MRKLTLIVAALVLAGVALRIRVPSRPAAPAGTDAAVQAAGQAAQQAIARMNAMMAEANRSAAGLPAGTGPAASAAALTSTPQQPATLRVVSETVTSIGLELTLPDGRAVEETIDFEPDARYTPTAAERAAQARTGREVYGARLMRLPDRGSGAGLGLHYFVPTAALPADLRQRLYPQPAALRLHLFSEAWAQPAMNLWTGIAAGYENKVSTPGGDLLKIYKNYEKVEGALDTSDQYAQWMEQFDAMEACARNPTHQITQNAYRDNPQYQQQTLDAIAQARSEATQATALSFLNQETSVAMQLTEAPALLKDATKSVAKWNDAALRDIGTGSVHDAGGLVDCDLAPPPNRHAGDGTLTYHMHREGWQGMYVSEDHLLKLDVIINPGIAAGFELDAHGDLKSKIVSKQEVGNVECMGTSAAHGAGYGGHLEMHGGPASGKCGPDHKIYTSVYHTDIFHSDNAFDCNFEGVDPVNGGSYEVPAIGEEAPYANCVLELKPGQR